MIVSTNASETYEISAIYYCLWKKLQPRSRGMMVHYDEVEKSVWNVHDFRFYDSLLR